MTGGEVFSTVSIEYLVSGARAGSEPRRGRVDYPVLLDDRQFALNLALCTPMKGLAREEGVPVRCSQTNNLGRWREWARLNCPP